MPHIVEIAFRGNRKEFFQWDFPDPPPSKSPIIVDADRGEDLGYVHAIGDLAERRNAGCSHGCGAALPARRALRLATKADVKQADSLVPLNEEARRKAMERVKANGLVMKISDAEWQWDRRKLTFYFTADKRVDFRNLVRELASLFRTRIELKQIGVRDEAKRLDGIGRCGRQYCSAAWLPDLRPVNLGVAKAQRLSLNPAQISGACGRLMCSLRYEHEFYVSSRKRFPKEGKVVIASRGEEKVVSIDLFRETVTLRPADGEPRTISLAQLRRETGEPYIPPTPSFEEPALEDDLASEISPELAYTSEFEIPAPRLVILTETVEGPEPSESDAPPARRKRRRGRRGGRRTKGGRTTNSDQESDRIDESEDSD